MLLLVASANAGLDDDLVFYLTFDNVKGRTIIDESGNGLDAEILENTEIVKGKYGDAIRLKGQSGDCVNIPGQEKLKVIGEITMMAWIYSAETWTTRGCIGWKKTVISLFRLVGRTVTVSLVLMPVTDQKSFCFWDHRYEGKKYKSARVQ